MGGLFGGGGSKAEPPPTPAPPPTKSAEEPTTDEAKRQADGAGTQSTILTSGAGDQDNQKRGKTLLGA